MKNIRLLIEYDGTNYHGWQRQRKRRTVQGEIEKAIKKITKEDVNIISSGRTDSGVHAKGQVANFITNSIIPGENYKFALNINLPEDIKVLESCEVKKNFHSRFSAKYKKYKYVIYNGKMPRPLYRNFSYHVSWDLDIEEMRKSLKYFIGYHDFESFMGRDTKVDTTMRTIYNMEIEKNGEFIEITIEGKSFLRNMIRIMVGTLVYIGRGRIDKENIPKIIQGKNRVLAGPTAPPQGLFLEKVYYEKNDLDIDKPMYYNE